MDKKKLIIASLVLLIFSAFVYASRRHKRKNNGWIKDMNQDSRDLILELKNVAQKVGISLKPKKNEFKRKYLKAFKNKMYENMASVKFEIKSLEADGNMIGPDFIKGYQDELIEKFGKNFYKGYRPLDIEPKIVKDNEVPDFFVPINMESLLVKKIIKRSIVNIGTIKELFSAVRSELNFEKSKIYCLLYPARRVFPRKGGVYLGRHIESGEELYVWVLSYRKEAFLKSLLHEINHKLAYQNVLDNEWSKNLYAYKGTYPTVHAGKVKEESEEEEEEDELELEAATFEDSSDEEGELEVEKVAFEDSSDEEEEEVKTQEEKKETRLLLQEDVVDPPANLANVIMTAYEISKSKNSFDKNLAQMWEVEKLFAIYQTAKILYLSGFENFDQFLFPKEGGPLVNQKIHVVEYHIIKAAIINNINGFLEVFINHANKGRAEDGSNRFKVSDKFADFVKNSLNDPEFKEKVNKLLKAFRKGKINNKKRWNVPQSFYNEGKVPEVMPKDLIFGSPTKASLFDTGRMDVIACPL